MIPAGFDNVPLCQLEWRVQQRIGSVIHAYEEQGFHRTGTDVDRLSGDWLANEVRQIGPEPTLEEFPLSRVDPVGASLVVNDRQIIRALSPARRINELSLVEANR